MNDFVASSANGFSAQPKKVGIGTSILVWLVLPGGLLLPTSASAQLSFTTYQYGTSAVTTVTGIRGDNMTGNYLGEFRRRHRRAALQPVHGRLRAIPVVDVRHFQLSRSDQQHPLRAELRFGDRHPARRRQLQDPASNPDDLGYLYDGAAVPAAQLTTLLYPGSGTINTLAHSTFGNQVVGNYDTILATGNAFIYDIPSGTFTTNNRPGAASTTAYGV